MKKILFACLVALVGLTLTLVINASKAQPAPAPAPAAKAAPAPVPEPHPEIHAAIHHLEEAKANLEKAAHDFGGHRLKALEHTNRALEECHEALNFEK